jgi:membrane fusion protein (multidrug efflux system)
MEQVATNELPEAAGKPKTSRAIVLGVLLLTVALGGGTYYARHVGREATDDAQVDGDLVGLPSRTQGVVIRVAFTDNQKVKAGDLLAELDSEPARARLLQAEAALKAAEANATVADADAAIAVRSAKGQKNVASASLSGASAVVAESQNQIAVAQARAAVAAANLKQAEMDLSRARQLLASGAIPQGQVDTAQTAYDGARANADQAKASLDALRSSVQNAQSHVQEASARYDVASDVQAYIDQAQARAAAAHAQAMTAKAARDLAQLDVTYTKILAPQDGIVSKKAVAVGQMVQNGQSIAMLAPTGQLWVTANFKETQLTRMREGQSADIEVDAFPGTHLTGEVESVSAATGARFSLLPPDNATGNYTKVVQRVPVRIKLKSPPAELALRPGMSVEAVIDTRR